MDCFETRKLLHVHADGELDALKSAEVDSHLTECASCAVAARELQDLRGRLTTGMAYYPAAPALRTLVEAMATSTRVRTGARAKLGRWLGWIRSAPGWTLAGGFTAGVLSTLAVFLAWQIGLQGGSQAGSRAGDLNDAVVSAHVRSLMAENHLTDVLSSDRHTVKPWFAGKLDFSPPVPDLILNGYPLLGGRIDYIGERPTAALVYRARNHTINVFVGHGGSGDNTKPSLRTLGGFSVVRWSNGGLDYWAVSDLQLAELADFATLLKQAS